MQFVPKLAVRCAVHGLLLSLLDMGVMTMTVETTSGAEILVAQDNVTVEGNVQYTDDELYYVVCVMNTPHPIVNMTPVVGLLINLW